MSLRLSPYPEYKESGVPWLGKVPRHWGNYPGFSAYKEVRRKNLGMVESTVLSLSYGRIVVKPSEKLHGLVPESFETYQIIDLGNIIIRPTDLQNDRISLRVGIAKNRGIITSAYICLKVVESNVPDYIYLLLHTYDVMKIFYGMGSGLRQNLDFIDLKRLPILIPPKEEQECLVRFIADFDRHINRLTRAKRRMIELLNEQKQAIIHRAVTRGLDPNARLKPSGVEWLGDVPEHWEAGKIKHYSNILRGKFTHRPRNDPILYDGPYPFIQTGDVSKVEKFITHYSQTLNEKGLAVSKMFPNGTLVMTIAANIGDVAVLTFDACFPDSVIGFIPKRLIDKDYLFNVFLIMKREFLKEAPINTQGNLNVERVGAMFIPIPPTDEQKKIVTLIEKQTYNLNSAIDRAHREITLLNEYRTRLIADVVTGKLDVRGVELPELGGEELVEGLEGEEGEVNEEVTEE